MQHLNLGAHNCTFQMVLYTFDCSIVESHILHYVEVPWVPARMVYWENVLILKLPIIRRLKIEFINLL